MDILCVLTYLNLHVYDILLIISVGFRTRHPNVGRWRRCLALVCVYIRRCAPFGDLTHANTSNLEREKERENT